MPTSRDQNSIAWAEAEAGIFLRYFSVNANNQSGECYLWVMMWINSLYRVQEKVPKLLWESLTL